MRGPARLREFPTTLAVRGTDGFREGKYHESLLRSFQVLQSVKEWLRLGTPAEVVLMLIDEAYARPGLDVSEYRIPGPDQGVTHTPPQSVLGTEPEDAG